MNNIKAIEDYCFGRLATDDALIFEANVLLNKNLAEDVAQERIAYAIIKQYSQKKIKAEILAAQEKLAALPEHQGFIKRIANLFKRH
ncbi:hypothetical protein [Pedobacter sp. W3I1]|uniref:hypothetical protein n=1 Tax=Pedobacter sp. W3I1 TaxID=3042291 RepID=UPI0027D8FC0A|nr:hypothetical protein [Pedobacter sp. W3I1]